MAATLLSPMVDYYNDEEELDSVDDDDDRSFRGRDSEEGSVTDAVAAASDGSVYFLGRAGKTRPVRNTGLFLEPHSRLATFTHTIVFPNAVRIAPLGACLVGASSPERARSFCHARGASATRAFERRRDAPPAKERLLKRPAPSRL